MTYLLREARPTQIYVPAEMPRPRTCALCGLGEPRVDFKEVSHLIPAGMGNRTWISREECDGCNHKYAEHDDELANMLSAARVIGRVRSRRGTAKVKAPGGLGSVGGGPFDGALTLSVHAEDPSVRLDWLPDNTAKLTFPQPAFRPFQAIRSIVRSCWLALKPEERARHGYLLDFVDGRLAPRRQ
jgi:hypothetical protein